MRNLFMSMDEVKVADLELSSKLLTEQIIGCSENSEIKHAICNELSESGMNSETVSSILNRIDADGNDNMCLNVIKAYVDMSIKDKLELAAKSDTHKAVCDMLNTIVKECNGGEDESLQVGQLIEKALGALESRLESLPKDYLQAFKDNSVNALKNIESNPDIIISMIEELARQETITPQTHVVDPQQQVVNTLHQAQQTAPQQPNFAGFINPYTVKMNMQPAPIV